MSRYEDLIPDVLYSDRIPAGEKYAFLYVGRKSIAEMRDMWLAEAKLYSGCVDATNAFQRMAFATEAQRCRKQAQELEKLMIEADDKPSVFSRLPTPEQPVSRIVCALPEAKGEFVECALMNARYDEAGELVYEVLVICKEPRYRRFNQRITFKPSLETVVLVEDWNYMKLHPNFLKLYLSIRANLVQQEKDAMAVAAG